MTEKFPIHYGDHFVGGELVDRTTIHESTKIDVEIDPETGEVTAVWFRCLNLPFEVFKRPNTARINPEQTAITAIEYLEGE